MNRNKILLTLSAVALLAAGLALSNSARSSAEANRIDATETAGPGPLDGLTFVGMLGPEGKPLDRPDIFVFEGGTFVSKECELQCDYPARPYSASASGDSWQFTSTTRCPYKDATIVWNGTVDGDRISGLATWTLKRWYWTIERDFAFEARLQSTPELPAGDS